MRFNDYANDIYALVALHTPPGENRKLRRDEERGKQKGTLQTKLHTPLLLTNGGSLSFIESIEITPKNEIVCHDYSYHYIHVDGYFFRYDKDPLRYRKHAHEICHLHANLEDVRYPTHSITLEEVLGFIIATFP
jgi:hypothetical protein